MNTAPRSALLLPDDPAPVRVHNPLGRSPFLLLGDHAGRAVPARLGDLGVSAKDRARHIGWDIGVDGLGEVLAKALDAVFIQQVYSRLVIDCNRLPQASDAMPETSDGTPIPGNGGIKASDRDARIAAIHDPYHAAIAQELARRRDAGELTVLISLHSFTPFMQGVERPWQIGVLHSDGDTRFAAALLQVLSRGGDLTVGDNQPYVMDATDFTVPRHAFAAGLGYAELEIRQDLLARREQQAEWAGRLAPLFLEAARLQETKT